MGKEYKKLYKAGKQWIAVTITILSVTLVGGCIAENTYADATTPEVNTSSGTDNLTQTSQGHKTANNSSETPANSPVKDEQNNSTQELEANQQQMSEKSSNELDPSTYGKVDANNWDYQLTDNNIVELTNYHWDKIKTSEEYRHIVLPNLNDFNSIGIDVSGKKAVGIKKTFLSQLIKNNLSLQSIAISKTTGNYNSKIIALDNDWSEAFQSANLINANLDNLDTSNITNMKDLFNFDGSLKALELKGWDTSNVSNMSGMFMHCQNLSSIIGLDNWNTSKVTDMSYMFFAMPATNIGNLSKWNTSNVSNMCAMFSGKFLNIGDLSRWNTSNVTNMGEMFSFSSELTTIGDLSQWNTEKVANMSGMFRGTTRLQNIGNLSKWNTSNVTDMSDMFNGAEALHNIGDLSRWDTSNTVRMSNMFSNTKKLGNIGKLDKWNLVNITNIDNMFKDSTMPYLCIPLGNQKNQLILHDNNGKLLDIIDAPIIYVKEGNEIETVKSAVTKLMQEKVDELNKDNNIYSNLRIAPQVIQTNIKNLANSLFIVDVKEKTITLSIVYVDTNGKTIKTDYIKKKAGSTAQFSLSLPEGYELATYNQAVTLIFHSNENQSMVVNIQKKEVKPIESNISTIKSGLICYVDTDHKIIKVDLISGKVGLDIPIKLSVPDGYILTDDLESIPSAIHVTGAGIKTLTINVKQKNNNSETKIGSINYVDENGKLIKAEQISGKIGDKINITLSLPEGYTLSSSNKSIPSSLTVKKSGIQTIIVNIIKNPISTITAGWHYSIDGWSYLQKDLTLAIGWLYIDGNWFYFNAKGLMETGLEQVASDGPFYYFNELHDGTYGAMKTGWQKINGYWYGFNSSNDGSALTGWHLINNKWYFFDQTGRASTGWFTSPAGNTFFFDSSNAWALTGWQLIKDKWYYFDQQNAWALKGWFKSSAGNWYYFNSDNSAATGWKMINNHWYYFDSNNAWAIKGWLQTPSGNWYYFSPTNAWALTGWKMINNHWYYFDQQNAWALKGWHLINKKWYYFDLSNSWILTGAQIINGKKYFFNRAGQLVY